MWIFGLRSREELLFSGTSTGELIQWSLQDVQQRSRRQVFPQGSSDRINTGKEESEDKDGDAEEGEGEAVHAKSIKAHNNPIYDVCLWGDRIVTGADEEIRIWKDLAVVGELRIPQLEGSRSSRSPVAETNGLATVKNHLVTAAGDGNAYIFDLESCKLVDTLSGHQDYLHCVVGMERTGLIATGSEDGFCKLWDIRSKDRCVASIPVGDLCSALCASNDGNWIVMGGEDRRRGTVNMCHVASRVVTSRKQCESSGRVQALEFTDSSLVIGGDWSRIEFWTKTASEKVVSIPTSSSSVYALDFNEEFGTLCVGGSSRFIDVFSSDRNQMMTLCA